MPLLISKLLQVILLFIGTANIFLIVSKLGGTASCNYFALNYYLILGCIFISGLISLWQYKNNLKNDLLILTPFFFLFLGLIFFVVHFFGVTLPYDEAHLGRSCEEPLLSLIYRFK
jgi:predicted membrane channel-forming protein YqfA (hemolysin III family)